MNPRTKGRLFKKKKRSLLNWVSSCCISGGARAASRASHHKRNRILSRWVGRQSKKLSTRIRLAVTASNVHCSLEIAPAATDESGVPGPAAPATTDGAVDAWMNTLPCKVANSCVCAIVHAIWTPWTVTQLQIQSNEHRIWCRILCRIRCCMRCCMQERTICRSKHAMSYTMRTYNVICPTYDIVCTYAIVCYDVVRAWRTTLIYNVVCAPRTASYGYDVVRAPRTTSCAVSVLYDVVRPTYDIVRLQESRCLRAEPWQWDSTFFFIVLLSQPRYGDELHDIEKIFIEYALVFYTMAASRDAAQLAPGGRLGGPKPTGPELLCSDLTKFIRVPKSYLHCGTQHQSWWATKLQCNSTCFSGWFLFAMRPYNHNRSHLNMSDLYSLLSG